MEREQVNRPGMSAKVAVIVPVAVAAVLYLVLQSGYLPLGVDLSLAAESVKGGGNGRIVPFVWATLLRLSWHFLPGSEAFRLSLVSLLAGVAAVSGYALVALRVLRETAVAAESGALREDSAYDRLPPLITMIAGLAMAVSPGMLQAATHVGPLTVQLALALLPFVIASLADRTPLVARGYLVFLIGMSAGLAAWEGMPGIVALPFAFALVWFAAVRGSVSMAASCCLFVIGLFLSMLLVIGDDLCIPRIRFELTRDFLQFLAFAVAPIVLFGGLAIAKLLRRAWQMALLGGLWAVLGAGLLAFGLREYRADYGRAANAFVDGVIASLDGRRWLVSDGSLDDLLRLRLPASVHLVTLRREHDPRHGVEIAGWAKTDIREADDALFLAAELGPVKFLEEWLSRAGAATNCAFVTLKEPQGPLSRLTIRPAVYVWKPETVTFPASGADEAWRREWLLMAPLLKEGEPGRKLFRDWFAVQGNAIGSLLQVAGEDVRAWQAYDFALTEMDGRNLSLLANLDEMIRRGKVSDSMVADRIKVMLRTEMNAIGDVRTLHHRIAVGGRLHVPKEMQVQLEKWRAQRNKDAWETDFGKRLRQGMVLLEKAAEKDGDSRKRALEEIETSLAPVLNASAGSEWAKHLYLGEVARLKGKEGFKTAQFHFRAMLRGGEGPVRQVFDRLLAIDLALGDFTALESDGLLVLRHDVNHQRANAIVGSVRLQNGDYDSAVRFLRRAVSLGKPSIAMRNDLALALSGAQRHVEAMAEIGRAEREFPNNWHILDSKMLVYAAAGRTGDAARTRQQAEECAMQRREMRAYSAMVEGRQAKPRAWWRFW